MGWRKASAGQDTTLVDPPGAFVLKVLYNDRKHGLTLCVSAVCTFFSRDTFSAVTAEGWKRCLTPTFIIPRPAPPPHSSFSRIAPISFLMKQFWDETRVSHLPTTKTALPPPSLPPQPLPPTSRDPTSCPYPSSTNPGSKSYLREAYGSEKQAAKRASACGQGARWSWESVVYFPLFSKLTESLPFLCGRKKDLDPSRTVRFPLPVKTANCL